MNNARYIEWALDTIDYQVYKKYFIKELSIHYKKEIRPLEFVKLYLGQDENLSLIHILKKYINMFYSADQQ